MDRFIVNATGTSSPKLLELQDDGTYSEVDHIRYQNMVAQMAVDYLNATDIEVEDHPGG